MAPSLLLAVAGTALFSIHALATEQTYQVTDSYTPDNFFSKFDFYEVCYIRDTAVHILNWL